MSLPDSAAVAAADRARSRPSSPRRRRHATRRPSATAISAARTASSPRGCRLIGGAPPDQKTRARPPRQRAEAGDRGALGGVPGRGDGAGAARRRRRRHAARPRAAPRPPPSAHGRARPHGSDLHAHGLRHRRGPRGRGRVALLRRAEHAGRASRARHAGHAVPRVARCTATRAGRRPCGRCCGRTPRRCRSATCRRTSRRSASSCPAASTAATTST